MCRGDNRAARLTKPRKHRLPHHALPILPPTTKPPDVSFDRWPTPFLIPPCSCAPFFGKRTHRVRLCEHRGLLFFHILNFDLFDSGQIEQDKAHMRPEHGEREQTQQTRSKKNKIVRFQRSNSVVRCFTHRAMTTIFAMSISPWFLGSATNPSRVEKIQAQDREVQNTNCTKNWRQFPYEYKVCCQPADVRTL